MTAPGEEIYKILLKIGQAFAETHDPGEVYASVSGHSAKAAGCKYTVLFLPDDDGKTLRPIVGYNVMSACEKAACRGNWSVKNGDGPVGRAFLHKNLQYIDETTTSEDFAPWRDEAINEQYNSMAAVPLVSRDNAVGVLGFYFEKGGPLTDDRRELIEAIALQASVAVQSARFHDQLARKNRELSALLETSKHINSDLSLTSVLNTIVSKAAELIGAEKSILFLWKDEPGVLEIAARKGLRGKEYDGLAIRLGEGVAGRVAETRKPLIVNDYQSSPYRMERFKKTHAFMAAPIIKGWQFLGVICVLSEDDGVVFRRDSLETLKLLGLHAAIAIDNAHLHRAAMEHADRLDSLIRIIKTLDRSSDLDMAFAQGCDEIRKVFETSGEVVYMVDPESNLLKSVYSDGSVRDTTRLCEGPDCLLIAGRASLSSHDADAIYCPVSYGHEGAFLCSAVRNREKLSGAIRIHSTDEQAFRNGDKGLLEAIGEQLAGVTERHALLRQVTHLAITDPLTGLYNKREFARQFDEMITRSERYRRPFSFLMMDLDNFKAYNDTLGHPAGDALLREIVQLVKRYIRDVDIFCRYGGDELCVLLPETGGMEAAVMAERIRKAVEAHLFAGEVDILSKITLTIGLSTFPENGRCREDIVREADKALYRAKRSGRNMVISSIGEAQ